MYMLHISIRFLLFQGRYQVGLFSLSYLKYPLGGWWWSGEWGEGSPWHSCKELPANAGDVGETPWVRKIPWSRKWPPIPVFLPGKSHGQRSLEGYSPWARKELDMTDSAHTQHLMECMVSELVNERIHGIFTWWDNWWAWLSFYPDYEILKG